MTTAPLTADRILPGVVLMLAFCVLAPLLDVASKLAAEGGVPVGQITTARFVVQGALMLPVVLVMRLAWAVSARVAGMVMLRAVWLILSTYSFVSGIAVMPVADALAIAFVEPFILLILGAYLFGDEVGPRRIGACAVGFCGALLVIQPSLSVFGYVALWPLGTAFFFAFYMLSTRAMAAHMHPVTMQMHTSLAGAAICLPLLWLFDGSGIAPLDAVWPGDNLMWLWLFGVGFWAALSHICMTYALKFAPSATLAPLHYLEIVAAVALGYTVFGDFPNALTWAGIGVIVASGLYLIHRERINARNRHNDVLADLAAGPNG
jgi:drug/metabolite transporter (DMT)-like permease